MSRSADENIEKTENENQGSKDYRKVRGDNLKVDASAKFYGRRRQLFTCAIIGQLIALACLAYIPFVTLTEGKVYKIEAEIVDPWNMFRGDYVHLSYEFSRVQTNLRWRPGQKVFAVLGRNSQNKWSVERLATRKPVGSENTLVLAGKIRAVSPGKAGAIVSSKNGCVSGDYVNIDFGIEQVFVPEGKGRQAEREKKLDILLAVSSGGNAVVKEAHYAGKTLYKWKLL